MHHEEVRADHPSLPADALLTDERCHVAGALGR